MPKLLKTYSTLAFLIYMFCIVEGAHKIEQFDGALESNNTDTSPRIHWCLDTTLLNLLKTTGTVTTIALFFCGIPICMTIR
ncbi:hypothetical protein DdX_02529 [Ditylenchus destructor]|uniref:Uncharacterized protein n=1 Tax=Ditylenchus destructor TaxID=166010 RepID=A0AAD4NEE8_9BILA|nr:hypothetical protein DdX_02529 [Ditylenchus destructor]